MYSSELINMYIGMQISWILLYLCGIDGISSTKRSYEWLRKWLEDDSAASEDDSRSCFSLPRFAL